MKSNYHSEKSGHQPNSWSGTSKHHDKYIQESNYLHYSFKPSSSNTYKPISSSVNCPYTDYNQQAGGYQPTVHPHQNKNWKPVANNSNYPTPSNETSWTNIDGHSSSRRARSKSPQKCTSIKDEAMPQLRTSLASTPLRYRNCSSEIPPCPTESFICEDDGNASPRHIRLTTHQIPFHSELSDKAGLIIGAVVQPFATIKEGEIAPCVISYSPVRCPSCNAYVNPHTKWMKSCREFKCNFCFEINETPELVADFNDRQLRYQLIRKEIKVELIHGLVEYIATKDYLKTNLNGELVQVRPGILFAIDVSYQSIHSGLLQSLTSTIRDILEELREDLDSWGTLQFGAITYDECLHFHNYDSAAVFVVPNVDDPVSPLPNDRILFQLQENKSYHAFLNFIEGLSDLFQENRNQPGQKLCVGAVMKVSQEVLSSTGGKVIVFQTGMPSVGIGQLKSRLDPNVYGTKEELGLLRGSVAFWNELASKATDSSEITVSFDIFLCAETYVDLASVAEVTRATGGQVYFYENYQDVVDSTRLYYDLKQNIMRFTGFDATMVVRASEGLEIIEQMGALTETRQKDIILPVVTCDSTICFKLQQNKVLKGEFSPCLQVAIIYTNIFGECMIRVLTAEFNTVRSMNGLYKQADLFAIVKFNLCQVAYKMLVQGTTTIKETKEDIIEACVEILYCYRVTCRTGSRKTELVLPESLRLLPMFTMCLLKHILLQDGVNPDNRVFHLLTCLTIPCDLAIPYVYPYMYQLHNLRVQDCTISDETKQIRWPKTCPLSKESLSTDGLYLINTGLEIFLIWGEQLPEAIRAQVLAEDNDGNKMLNEDPPNDPDNLGWKVKSLISEIRWNRPYYQPLRIVKRPVSCSSLVTSIQQRILLSRLLQDAKRQRGQSRKETQIEHQSYMDFLVLVHKKIQSQLANW